MDELLIRTVNPAHPVRSLSCYGLAELHPRTPLSREPMSQGTMNSSQFAALEKTRPVLRHRIEQYQDELCHQMIEIIDRLQTLEEHLQRDAEYQDMIDARLNAIAYREAAEALVGADSALALAARKMCFQP